MSDSRKPRASRLVWVRIGDMTVSPKAQRNYQASKASNLAAKFDLEAIGFPVVNKRDGRYWIVDGQHRIGALKLVGFSDDDQIQVECYEGLSEAEEAEQFLTRDDRTKISTFDRFRISVVAGRDEEKEIERIVHDGGFRIAQGKRERAIGAVESLRFAYDLSPAVLGRTLCILGAAFDGDPEALTSDLLKGMALVCQRYNGSLDDSKAVQKLAGLTGGPVALKRKAEALKLRTGHSKPQCAAGAIVEALNSGRGGNNLGSWWS